MAGHWSRSRISIVIVQDLQSGVSFRRISGVSMELGIVGLGMMGAGMARRLARGGAHVICYDNAEAARKAIAGEPDVNYAENLAALCARLAGERVIVIMLSAGEA